MFLPEGHDPDTLVAAEGAEAFESRLKTALPLSEYLVQQLVSQVDLDPSSMGVPSSRPWRRRLFARMPDGIYREMLADRLAAEIRHAAPQAEGAPFRSGAGGPPQGPVPPSARTAPPRPRTLATLRRSRMSVGRGNLLTQAIALVLHHPAAARAIDRSRGRSRSVDKPGFAVLHELLEQADRDGPAEHCDAAGALA